MWYSSQYLNSLYLLNQYMAYFLETALVTRIIGISQVRPRIGYSVTCLFPLPSYVRKYYFRIGIKLFRNQTLSYHDVS